MSTLNLLFGIPRDEKDRSEHYKTTGFFYNIREKRNSETVRYHNRFTNIEPEYAVHVVETKKNPEELLNHFSQKLNFQYCCSQGEESKLFGIKPADIEKIIEELEKNINPNTNVATIE